MSDDKNYYVHPTASVEDNVTLGDGTKVWHFCQIRTGAKLGDNCILGKSSFVDFDVSIGNNVKIQNLVSVYHGVTIEDDVFIGPHVCFTNDFLPRANLPDWKLVKTLVKKGASLGANSTIICGITVGTYSMIGAGSVVTKNTEPFSLVFGNPAKFRGYACYCGSVIKKLDQPLPAGSTLQCENCKKSITI